MMEKIFKSMFRTISGIMILKHVLSLTDIPSYNILVYIHVFLTHLQSSL